MKRTSLILVAGLTMSLASVAVPETIEQHEHHQQKRIRHGNKSGELTKKESAKIQKDEAAVDEDRAAAEADGKVTKKERKEIRHDQKQVSQEIYRKKHNDQTR